MQRQQHLHRLHRVTQSHKRLRFSNIINLKLSNTSLRSNNTSLRLNSISLRFNNTNLSHQPYRRNSAIIL